MTIIVISKEISSDEECRQLELYLETAEKWRPSWHTKLNTKTCKYLRFSKKKGINSEFLSTVNSLDFPRLPSEDSMEQPRLLHS